MTAPFAPPPSRSVVIIVVGLVAVAVAIPFGRRDDWAGWVAFLTVAAVAVGCWGLLMRGAMRAILQWWRGGPDST